MVERGLSSSTKFHHLQSFDQRVIGGADAEPGAHLHQMSLQVDEQYFCGGSLITDQWVLTTANCVYGKTTVFIAGTVDKTDKGVEADGTGVRIPAAEFHSHPEVDLGAFKNDIALIKLARHIKLSDKIQCVKLPSENHNDSILVLVIR